MNTTDKLSAFVGQCLQPVPGGVPADRHYNRLARDVRAPAWRRADAKTAYYEALLDVHRALIRRCAPEIPVEDQFEFGNFNIWLQRWQEALFEQMITPAPAKVHVAWKQRQIEKFKHRPDQLRQVEKAIADDEAFLAAHPVQRPRRAARPS
jgi:hypothetical protein